MIKQVEITNFRNIKSMTLNFDRVSVITGKNNLGKSNALNAVSWLITDTLLTDNYGSGEKDTQSLIPVNAQKGEHTSVCITLDNGSTFRKTIKRGYDRLTGKANKHSTSYEVNDSMVSTSREFYENLYQALDFTPTLHMLKVDEVRVYTDPLYALLKLDYKDLRKLLVNLGCSVSNEELYETGFEDMKKYEEKYFGKWDVMRKALKEKSNDYKVQTTELESQLKLYDDIDTTIPFDNSETLKKLEAEKSQKIIDRNALQNGGDNVVIANIQKELDDATADYNFKKKNKELEIKTLIEKKKSENQSLYSTAEVNKYNAVKDIIKSIEDKNNESIKLKEEQANLRLASGRVEIDCKSLNYELLKLNEQKEHLSDELGTLINNPNQTVVCPICGSPFELHEEERMNKINELSLKIEELDKKIEEKQEEINKTNLQIEKDKKSIEDLVNRIREFDADIKILQAKKTLKENEYSVDNRAKELEKEIETLERTSIDSYFTDELAKISEIETRLNNAKNETENAVQEEVEEINKEIDYIKELIKNEAIKEEKYDTKVELLKKLELTTMQWNNNDSLLARLNEMIQTMCQLINNKAKALTGFNFVLLENNLTNDSITECCYVVDECGVPFKDINTARKTEMGIQFIEAIQKSQNSHNQLPILADRLEGIDDINKIGTFTSKQVICTRVSMLDSIEVQNL